MKKLLAIASAAVLFVGCSGSDQGTNESSTPSRSSRGSSINEPSGSTTSTNMNTNSSGLQDKSSSSSAPSSSPAPSSSGSSSRSTP